MSILEIISLSIFLGSSIALVILFLKKTPLLVSLPKTTPIFAKKINIIPVLLSKTRDKVRTMPLIKNFSFEIFLQRILSKIRILTLKAENKTGSWLESLRKKSNKNSVSSRNALPKDNYWENLQNKKDDNPPE